jgi:NADH-quinone oxidoreductase subunit H
MNFYTLSLLKAAVWAAIILSTLAYLQWVERKVLAHIQLRMGPSRVGPHGLLQPLADVIKLLTKEDLIPPQANKFLYILAPFLAVALSLLPVAVLPFGPDVEIFGIRTSIQLTDLNIGVLFLLAISSLRFGIAGGLVVQHKYALLGGLRASAQMVSYELPMALAVAAPLLLANTLSLKELALSQSGYYFGWIPQWNFFKLPAPQFVSYAIFLMAAFAETNRVPFDLPEAENELVAGFHTEYSSLKFACFFMAEYANMITSCAFATCFPGGWLRFGRRARLDYFPRSCLPPESVGSVPRPPGPPKDRITLPVVAAFFLGMSGLFQVPVLHQFLMPMFWFGWKTGVLLFFFMWVRGTLPRFRYDQLMAFTWKLLFPVAMLNLLVTAFLVAVFGG